MELLIALVDNGSQERQTIEGIREVLAETVKGISVRHLRYDVPFNYSRLNNLAIASCTEFGAEYILFLNNDVDVTDRTTVAQMATFLNANPHCGSVGCTLLYPNLRVQHLFIFVGCKIAGAHPFKGQRHLPRDDWMLTPRPVAGATAALLMMRTIDFKAVGGFDEELALLYQDIDLALKLNARGFVNWVLPYISAVHHETQSRDRSIPWADVAALYARWGDKLYEDAYVSERFSRWSERLVLSLGEGRYPWQRISRLLKKHS
jgi:GT2 family glycosyltransferase